MTKRSIGSTWARTFQRSMLAMTRMAKAQRKAAPAASAGLPGLVVGAGGARRYRLYRPADIPRSERLPLMVMLHGCGQDADSFAASTRMNRVAQRERFMVLYPEQDRLANAQGCWNWFDTKTGRAQAEAALVLQAIDQACLLHAADPARVALAGLSAGASMAALLATRHPDRFKALVMHSGIPPGTANSTLTALRAMHGQRRTQPLAATPDAMAQHWPPLLVIHGDADAVVSPHNGRAAAQAWADAAGAEAGSARGVQRGKRHAMVVTDYKHQGHTVATLAAVAGLAHAWSGGAASKPYSDARGPDASRMAWAFALQQFRR
jgi:poly(hydroxyalkanoate) depolymerase family esterase